MTNDHLNSLFQIYTWQTNDNFCKSPVIRSNCKGHANIAEMQRSERVGRLLSSSNSEILRICFLGQQKLALGARAGLVVRVLRWHPRFISGPAGHGWVWELPSFTRDGCPQRRPYVKLSQPKPQAAARWSSSPPDRRRDGRDALQVHEMIRSARPPKWVMPPYPKTLGWKMRRRATVEMSDNIKIKHLVISHININFRK